MTDYLLALHYDSAGAPPAEELKQIQKELDVVNAELKEAGSWVFSGGIPEPDAATVVRVRNGEVLTTDGPYLETKEHLGGFWVIGVADLDAALAWATRLSGILGLAVEVSPFAPVPD